MKSKTLITTLGLTITAISAAGLGSSKLFSQSNSQSKEKTQEMENETMETIKGLDTLKESPLGNLEKIPELKPEDSQKSQKNSKEKPRHYFGENGAVLQGTEGEDYQLEDLQKEDCVEREGSYLLMNSQKQEHKCFFEIKKTN